MQGVSWDKGMECWRARHANQHVGYFASETEAAKAYDVAATAVSSVRLLL